MDLLDCLMPGKIIEIQGEESTGKTTLALEMAKSIQDKEGIVAYIDVDHKFNIEYASNIIDANNLYIYQCNTTQDILKTLKPLIKLNIISAVVIDSIGVLMGENESSKEVSKFLIDLSTLIVEANAVCILVNQYRYNGTEVQSMYNKIVNLYSSVRVKTEYADGKYTSTILKNKLKSYKEPLAL